MYLIPLPPDIWTKLEGRLFVAEGYTQLDLNTPWLPISLHPEKTFFSLFDFLPVIAVGLITLLSPNKAELSLARQIILTLAAASAFLGLVQILSGGTNFRMYDTFNVNRPIGFFSNTNHFASFMAMSIPLSAWTIYNIKNEIKSPWRSIFDKAMGGTTLVLAISGVLLSGSSAGYLILLYCFPFTMIILYQKNLRTKILSIAIYSIILLLLIDFFVFSGEVWQFLDKFTVSSSTSRIEILNNSLNWRQQFGLLGIGPGAFENIYQMKDTKIIINNIYVNNVHNDYVQIFIELGLPGLIVLISFLVWYFLKVFSFIKKSSQHYKLIAIYLLSLSIPILHSFVDYPLRTIAISATFTFLITMVAREGNTPIFGGGVK